MGVTMRGLDRGDSSAVAVHRYLVSSLESDAQQAAPQRASVAAEPALALDAEDERWVAAAQAMITAQPDLTLSRRPALVSVSQAKQALRGVEDRESAGNWLTPPSLTTPGFAAGEDAADGQRIGTAVHRFMMHANLAELSAEPSVRAQAQSLVTAGKLAREDAELLPTDDIAWLGSSPLGAHLANHAHCCRREMPFLYAVRLPDCDERVLLRGVIDCLIDVDGGVELIDYKTDRPTSDADWSARIETYTLQLQLYVAAAESLFSRPARRATLAFLCGRRIVDVDVSGQRLEAARAAVVQIASVAPV
jgi:ATP-dependent helicase/nuclease subunit A